MRLVIGILFIIAVASALGLGATWVAVTHDRPFGRIAIGPWSAWPHQGASEADPYARAALARAGNLPLGLGDTLEFHATRDGTGKILDGRCDVTISGRTPVARYWTLTLYDHDGRLIPNALGRHGFTSQELIRRPDGSFDVIAAASVRAGNWLPTGGAPRYRLVLRLYDTTVGMTARASRELPIPVIATAGCP